MGKKNKNKHQQRKQNGINGNQQISDQHKRKKKQQNDQNQFIKPKYRQQQKENEFVAQFEHRQQKEKPAVLLKKELSLSQEDKKNINLGVENRQKNKWRNDDETDENQRVIKRRKIESDSDSVEDEEGDDLEEFAEQDEMETDDESLDDEEFGSFINDEDDSEQDNEEDDENDVSATDLIDLDILGYEPMTKNKDCLVLQAKPDYSIAASQFCLHKFSDGLNDNSVQIGLKALRWILNPVDTQFFFSAVFQKRLLVVKRAKNDYLDGFFCTNALLQMLQNNCLEYNLDVNIASYENGIRLTHTPHAEEGEQIGSGRVYPAVIKDHIAKGRSVQCVCPQAFDENIFYLCEILQEVYCSFVGANCYLTPANSAGFAPHWDDIDAFMLQVEGKKYWKVFAPVNNLDSLPLKSSRNFADSDFIGRQPVFEGWLEQGDTLYVPRGFIHQAKTGPDIHSLHVTVSVCRRFSYADFFERASAEFIQMLTTRSRQLRHSLPPLLFDMGGVSKLNYTNDESLDSKILPVSEIVAKKFGTDFSAFIPSFIDIMAKEFFKTALPPLLTPIEKEFSCIGGSNVNLYGSTFKFNVETEVRLIRKHGQRLFFENENKAFIMHRMDNSRRYNDDSPGIFLDFPIELEDGYIKLADAYPEWITVSNLGLTTFELNVKLAILLFNNCLLLRRKTTGKDKEMTAENNKKEMKAKKKTKKHGRPKEEKGF